MEANAGKSGFRGYFEAAQFPSGRVTINVVSTNPTLRTGRLSSNDPSIELSFQGESVNGWTIACSGHNDFFAVQLDDSDHDSQSCRAQFPSSIPGNQTQSGFRSWL